MNSRNFVKTKRQFSYLSDYINRLIISHEWTEISEERRNRLIENLNRFFSRLHSYFSKSEMKKVLAGAALFIGIPMAQQAQSFAPPVQNPFGYAPPATYLVTQAYADIDNDGDMDLFTCSYAGDFHFYRNTGTPEAPAFDSLPANPFGLNPPGGLAFMAMTDIDDDGDADILTGDYEGKFAFYQNTGTVSNPAFAAPQQNPFGLVPANVFAIPAFADIDNDGDQDLFAGEYEGNTLYFKNTGTANVPVFGLATVNPFGLTPAEGFGTYAFADTDHDGDLDLYMGEYYGNTRYFENTGTATNAAFAAPVNNPFGLVQLLEYSFPAFVDLDNDGDLDLPIMENYGVMKYFRNTEINTGLGSNDLEIAFEIFPNPANDVVTIKTDRQHQGEIIDVVITDMQGREVRNVQLNNSQPLQVNTSDLPSGIYMIRIIAEGQTYNRKLVIR